MCLYAMKAMLLRDLTEDQIRNYYQLRLGHQLRGLRNGRYQTKCPFHNDSTPSFAIRARDGAWICFSGYCGKGTLLAFEMVFSNTGKTEAVKAIARLVGTSFVPRAAYFPYRENELLDWNTLEGTYSYTDEKGKLLFQVLRFAPTETRGKRFLQRKPNAQGGWTYSLDEGGLVRRVPYRFPEVLRAREVIITEGEKDCDLVRNLVKGYGIAVTTNPGGAGKWKDEYVEYFRGKNVVIFTDKDLPDARNQCCGQIHAESVARSLRGFGVSARCCFVNGFHDVGDFVIAGASAEALFQIIRNSK